MTEEEILKLSDEELRVKIAELAGWKQIDVLNDGVPYGVPPTDWKRLDDPFPADEENVWVLPDYPNDIAAAMDLFNEVYNPMGKIRHGAWVLSTVDDGKDCSLATLFFGAPSRQARRQGRKNRPLKAQAKAKKKEMARAITLAYVMAMEGATVDLRYQPEEA